MNNNLGPLDKLANWLNKFKRYTISYKNGAFRLHNLFNSPETMIESFDQMMFCHLDRAKKQLTSDTIFITSNMYYCQPEPEFWVMPSNLQFKKNVLMENLYDKKFPIEYHFINIHCKVQTLATKSLVNGLVMKESTWSMFKAGHAKTEYHFKNSNEKNITIFFTSRWLEKCSKSHPDFKDSKLIDFFKSSATYMIIQEEGDQYERIHDELMRLAEQNEKDEQNEKIKALAYEVLVNFIRKLTIDLPDANHFELNDRDRERIQRVGQYLNESLLIGFPGVETIAKKVGVSPTKLKSDFKKIHNTSLYKYFSHHQMLLAHQLLSEKKHTVSEVAKILGYENASKFAAVFKKHFDIQPSSLKE